MYYLKCIQDMLATKGKGRKRLITEIFTLNFDKSDQITCDGSRPDIRFIPNEHPLQEDGKRKQQPGPYAALEMSPRKGFWYYLARSKRII